jgi:hypothetical protein
MNSKVMEQIRQIIDASAQAQSTPMEFELAYQARVAMDRIRFAIKHTEQFAPHTDQMQEAGLQLLDALERLEAAERNFQRRFRCSRFPVNHHERITGGNGCAAKDNLKGVI